MAEHRAEQITKALVNTLAHLYTTRENVFRGRARRLNDDQLPALSISTSRDEFLGKYNPALIDRDLVFTVEGYAKESAENIEAVLNKIRTEVTIALMADTTLGLAFVHDVNEGNASYDLDEETDQKIGLISTEWVVTYRRELTDPST